MKLLDKHIQKLGDDLKETITNDSKIRICASIFSMYGFEASTKDKNRRN